MRKKYSLLTAVSLLLVICVILSGCLKYSGNIINGGESQTEEPATISSVPAETLAPPVTQETEVQPTQPPVTIAVTTESPTETPQPVMQPQPTQEQTTVRDKEDPAQWTTEEILSYLTTAINTTKAYSGNLSIDHTEAFTFNITKCPGGSIGVNLASMIASGVLKPNTETLHYSGGMAVDSEGKTVPILLPKRTNFSLPAEGVKNATASKSGNNTVIEVTLVEEHGSIDTAPKYNAGAIGYLDSNDLDLSLLTIKTLDVSYPGSTMVVQIDEQGRVVSASYTVYLAIDASGSAMGFSGSFACNGSQKEDWKLNW